MQIVETGRNQTLQAGQLWELEQGYVEVVEVGKRLVHYKTLHEPNQKAAVTRMIGVEALLKYLTHCEGRLMQLNAGF